MLCESISLDNLVRYLFMPVDHSLVLESYLCRGLKLLKKSLKCLHKWSVWVWYHLMSTDFHHFQCRTLILSLQWPPPCNNFWCAVHFRLSSRKHNKHSRLSSMSYNRRGARLNVLPDFCSICYIETSIKSSLRHSNCFSDDASIMSTRHLYLCMHF